MQHATVPEALAAALARDPARPFVTHLGADGSRTELSVRTFENNVAKAANLLRDDADLGSDPGGGTAVLDLPLHWQTAVWLGACGLVGATAWLDGDPADPAAELAVLSPGALDRGRAPLTLATALHPLGMPFREPLPAGVLDAAVEVRAHGDRFTAYRTVGAGEPWLRLATDVLTQGEALAAATALAARVGLEPGGRVLVARPAGAPDLDGLLALLAVPLALDAAVVVLEADAGADLDAIADRERCTAVLP